MTEESNQVTLMELRKRLGLTRRQLAIAVGLTEKTIYIWETKPIEPRMTVVQVKKLMEALDCSIDELIEAIENRSKE